MKPHRPFGRGIPGGPAWRAGTVLLLAGLVLGGVARAQAPGPANTLDDFERQILALTRTSEPYVVNIIAELARPAPLATSGRGGPGPLYHATVPQRRIGSGIAIDQSGHIITTASIVDGSAQISVRNHAGMVTTARLVGLDRRTNIALLEAPGIEAPLPRLGESSLVPPGSRVLVVCSVPINQPMSSFGTVEVDRGIVLGYSEVEMLQMNAPVIRGSSGAAVFNSEGRVVGMIGGALDTPVSITDKVGGGLAGYVYGDRVIASRGTDVSFAIPIEKALEIAAELNERGQVERGFLGVMVQRADKPDPNMAGIRVVEVLPHGPADVAGIRIGDVLLTYAGRPVTVGDDLTFLVSATRPGSRVAIDLTRGGAPMPIEVVVGLAPNLYPSSARPLSDPSIDYPGAPTSTPPRTGAPGGGRLAGDTSLAPRH